MQTPHDTSRRCPESTDRRNAPAVSKALDLPALTLEDGEQEAIDLDPVAFILLQMGPTRCRIAHPLKECQI